jgi:alpha-beta hydrolase superfamily lysophospholipase
VSLLLQRVYREHVQPKAQICMVHGLGEHSGRFLGMAKAFATEGYSVFSVDLRGYGCSGGGRCQGSLREFLSDVQRMTERVDNEIPLFFWGNSMGAAIVNLFLLSNPQLDVAGVILSSPFYRFPKEVKVDAGKRMFVSFLARNVPVDERDSGTSHGIEGQLQLAGEE